MSRPLALALIALSLASCKSYPGVDPIYGRQRIPPQRTGTIGAIVPGNGSPPPAGYYDPSSGGPSNLPAAPGSSGSGGDLTPPGGFGFQGSSSRTVVPDAPSSSGWNRPGSSSDFGSSSASSAPLRTGPDDSLRRTPDSSNYGPSRYENPSPSSGSGSSFTPSPPASGSSTPFPPARDGSLPAAPNGADNWRRDESYRSTSGGAAGSRDVGGEPSYDRSSSGVTQGYTSAASSGSGQILDIADLPARGALHPDDRPADNLRPAGYAAFAPPNETSQRVPAAAAAPAAAAPIAETSAADASMYGYDASYRRLKGHLEYSPTNQRWKLRYIPITGRTDQYGGSVMLEDSPALKELHRGDAVIIEGQIVGDSEPGSFAPLYRAERISRIR
jgi:hypothetical protein